ncbi:MAG: hypothetical protein GY765_09030 [bacterium]|nr:hypothetical protein [bacterium]
MKKRIVQVLVFVMLVSMGIALIGASGSSQQDCRCFNEDKAEAVCQDLCQFYTGTNCWYVDGLLSLTYCSSSRACTMAFWSNCMNGNHYRRYVTTSNCSDC